MCPTACHSIRRRALPLEAVGEELGLQLPGRTTVARALAEPVERIGRDVDETPAHRCAGIILALLHDVLAARTAELPPIELPQRVAPENVPCVEAGIVDPQRRAVEDAGQNPDVL